MHKNIDEIRLKNIKMPIVNWDFLCYNIVQMIKIGKYAVRSTERNVVNEYSRKNRKKCS